MQKLKQSLPTRQGFEKKLYCMFFNTFSNSFEITKPILLSYYLTMSFTDPNLTKESQGMKY